MNEWAIVADQWNQTQGARFEVRSSDLNWNFLEQELVQYRIAMLASVPVIYGTATAKGIDFGLSPTSIWLSLWGRIEEGQERKFIDDFSALAKSTGRSRMVLGADEFHFTPGVPADSASGMRLKQALLDAKFEGAEAGDFIGPAKSAEVDAYIDEAASASRAKGWRFLPVETSDAEDALAGFLEREFAGRWTREFSFWRARPDTRRAFWMMLKRESEEVLGFARMAVRSRVLPIEQGWSPGALRLPLRASDDERRMWSERDACLGPIGVATSLRGQGAGRVLLGRVLETLQSHNAGRICVDWTNAFKYYEPLKFELTRKYWTAWKSGLD